MFPSSFLVFAIYLYDSVAVAHHGDQEIQQNDHVDHRVRTKHQQTPESCIRLYTLNRVKISLDMPEKKNISLEWSSLRSYL